MKSALWLASRTWKTRGLKGKGAKIYYDGVAYQLRVAMKHWRQLYEAESVDTEIDEANDDEAETDDGVEEQLGDEDSDSTLTLEGPAFSCIQKSTSGPSWMLQDMVNMGVAAPLEDASDGHAKEIVYNIKTQQ